MNISKVFSLFFLVSLCAALLLPDLAVAQPPSPGKNKKEKGKKGSVFSKGAFEVFGEETLEISPEATPDTKKATEKATPATGGNAHTSGKRVRTGRGGTGRQAKDGDEGSRKANSSNVISVDLDGLYNVTIDTVEVFGKRPELSFKTREDIKFYYNQALLKIAAKDYEGALKFLNKSLKEDSYNKELLQLRGNVNVELLRYRKGLKDYRKAIKVDGADPVLHYNLGAAYTKRGKFEEAIEAFDKAVALDSDYLYALQARAAAKTMIGDYEGSIEDYNRVLDQNAFFVAAFKGRGVAKSMLGRYDEAISDFSYTIEMKPEDGLAYYYRGLAYISNNELYKGCDDFDRAYQLKIPQAYEDIKSLCR